MGATASFYAGALVGTVPDPVNYIPFVGSASKAKSAAVLGKIAHSVRLGRGATTATDAVLGTALLQPLVFAERDTYQLKYDTRDALTERKPNVKPTRTLTGKAPEQSLIAPQLVDCRTVSLH